MSKPATAQDAELVLKLYDLRREPEMRKARNFVGMEFWPTNYTELEKTAFAMGSDGNRYFRQVLSFWEMAASLVLHGAINEDLFLEPGVSGEMFFVYAKLKPLIPEIREKMQSPEFLANVEKVINRNETGRKRLEQFEKRIAMIRQRVQQHAQSQAAKG